MVLEVWVEVGEFVGAGWLWWRGWGRAVEWGKFVALNYDERKK
jgi:hypothetical protein